MTKDRDEARQGASESGKKPETSRQAQERAEADDITLGDEAQKQRDKMQRQEKAEGDERG